MELVYQGERVLSYLSESRGGSEVKQSIQGEIDVSFSLVSPKSRDLDRVGAGNHTESAQDIDVGLEHPEMLERRTRSQVLARILDVMVFTVLMTLAACYTSPRSLHVLKHR